MNTSAFTGFLLALLLLVPALATADSAGDVESMEQKRMQAILNVDMPALYAIYADDFFYNTGSGVSQTKAQYLPRYASGEIKVTKADSEPRDIRVYENTALVTGIVHVNLTNKGEDKRLHLRYLNVWVKRANGWVLVARQSTNLAEQK
ncbi:MAG: nuclear transport factor 2 family protein [Betaproteobacteria bacterium]